MTGKTVVEGLPYPTESDFADVQDAFRLATAIDSDLRADQASFRQFIARPSFIGLQTVTQSGITVGTEILTMQTVEWDNTGGLTAGATFWSQPLAQPPSWWLFGATIRVNPTGAQVVGDLNMGTLFIQTVDQVTGLSSFTTFRQRNDDTNTNGEWINLFAMAPIYQGLVQAQATFNGSTAKGILAGSRLWGMYMGPVT